MSIKSYVRSPHKFDEHEVVDVCRGCGDPITTTTPTTKIDGRVHCNVCVPKEKKPVNIEKIIQRLKDEGII
jgi:hypothetical protein